MPKHNLNEVVKIQEELQEKLNKANSTAIAAMVIGSVALLITLFHLAVS